MSESVRSMLLGPSGLYVIAAIALIPTVSRRVRKLDTALYDRFIHLFLVGISCQCLHFVEEFVTGFHHRFPVLLGLAPWSSEFFVTLNLAWIALWVVSPIGLRKNFQPAFFPVWFLTFAMIANG
ncbi:MAG: hypothetical protein GY940_30350, partial [bacterium]|nr:hypothetical protein [bacterium]